ncbi:long-chain-fatty-acid--CoA ligase [Desertibacillus haloalkaliphilus]|uniref:long-chain-fatty-acid--CoA ligase n=1 Tax=Desertibacillus haloalkaliphilus TaxID=1328930 RepID=UPI001C257360|nr:long-chain fatty acid--CoA ligase [Desertibacillus haloalkaliphilus]MBU8907550.1 long-chain fatty acid--CoA ligase [Desertibacillus haloalkaliphilus]
MGYHEKPWLSLYGEHVSEHSQVKEMSLADLLKWSVETYGDQPALSFYEQKWSFKEVSETVQTLTNVLHSIGFTKGDRLAIMLPNTPHYVFTLFAVAQAGGVNVQVNPMYVEREVEHVLNDSGATHMIVLDRLYPLVKKVQAQTSLEKIIVVQLEEQQVDLEEGDLWFDEVKSMDVPQAPDVSCKPDEDIALLQYTGGTTGVSKGVMLTHKNLMANAEQIYDFMFRPVDVPDAPKIMSILPMFHIYGLTCNVFLGFRAGCNQIILPRFELEEVVQTVKREKPFQFSAVPTMYIALNSHPNLEEYGFDQVDYYNSGGAAMPVEQLHLFEKRTGCNLCEGYGLSEASPTTHFNPPFRKRRVGSIGIPLPSLDAKVFQETDHGFVEAPIGEVGELAVKGPQVMKGYWKRPAETDKVLKDGWLFTGDMARMDEDGYFYIVDRKKDMIIASGYNVYPREIEEVLYQHPAVQEVIVVGVPDAYRGETVKAFIALKDQEIVTEAEIISYSSKFLAAYKVPKFVEFREELPKSAVGKLLRRSLRDEELKRIEN